MIFFFFCPNRQKVKKYIGAIIKVAFHLSVFLYLWQCIFFHLFHSGQGDTDYHGSNGQADTHSLHSSHLSVQDDPLLIRTHKQQTSQQVRVAFFEIKYRYLCMYVCVCEFFLHFSSFFCRLVFWRQKVTKKKREKREIANNEIKITHKSSAITRPAAGEENWKLVTEQRCKNGLLYLCDTETTVFLGFTRQLCAHRERIVVYVSMKNQLQT